MLRSDGFMELNSERTMRKLAKARLTGGVIACTAICVTLFFAKLAFDYQHTFRGWISAHPMEVTLDLSRPGTVTVPFHQTCSVSHGEGVFVDGGLKDDGEQIPQAELNGLSGSIVIQNAADEEIVARHFKVSEATLSDSPGNSGLVSGGQMLVEIPTFSQGEYTATITIEKGVAALSGQTQRLYAKYQLCGLEQIPVVVLGFISFCAGVVGLFALVAVLPGFLRSGIWREVIKAPPPPESQSEET